MASVRKKKLFKMWMDHKKKKNPISISEELMKIFERRYLQGHDFSDENHIQMIQKGKNSLKTEEIFK